MFYGSRRAFYAARFYTALVVIVQLVVTIFVNIFIVVYYRSISAATLIVSNPVCLVRLAIT